MSKAWEQVAGLLREHGRAFVRRGSINALETWLTPLPPELMGHDPELLNLVAAVRSAQGKGDEALALGERAVRMTEEALPGGGRAAAGVKAAPGDSEVAAGSTRSARGPECPRARLVSLRGIAGPRWRMSSLTVGRLSGPATPWRR